MPQRHKKLELVWKGKGEHVLQNPETGKWEFCGSDTLPPRPLIEVEAFGDEKKKLFNPDQSNLLIHGENLFALQALLPYYAGKVKLIYIDPPFNTGNGFLAYNDNFTHSIWLSMVQERLGLLKKLLRADGMIFVHIDSEEASYLRVVLDQVFGRHNFLGQITWERSAVAGLGLGGKFLVNVTEYILAYTKDFSNFQRKVLVASELFPEKTLRKYNRILLNAGKRHPLFSFKAKSNELAVKVFKHAHYEINTISYRNAERRRGEILHGYIDNFDKIFATFLVQKENQFQHFIISKLPDDGLYSVDYTPSRGKHKERATTLFYFKKELVGWLKDIADIQEGVIYRNIKMSDLWTKDAISSAVRKEGGVTGFDRGKKPEALMKRILDIASKKDDLVLDCFSGSGTTGAVAHKMGRRWIMVETEKGILSKSMERLRSTVKGSDASGVTKIVNWRGGGGFRFLQVGAPLLVEDPETKLTILNPKYTNGPLTRAVCSMEGFLLTGDPVLHGRNESHYAHVTEDFVDSAYAYYIAKKLPSNSSLTIYALRVRKNLKLPPRTAIKRMNTDLVKPYLRSIT